MFNWGSTAACLHIVKGEHFFHHLMVSLCEFERKGNVYRRSTFMASGFGDRAHRTCALADGPLRVRVRAVVLALIQCASASSLSRRLETSQTPSL